MRLLKRIGNISTGISEYKLLKYPAREYGCKGDAGAVEFIYIRNI